MPLICGLHTVVSIVRTPRFRVICLILAANLGAAAVREEFQGRVLRMTSTRPKRRSTAVDKHLTYRRA